MTTTATSTWTLALTGISYTFEVIDVEATLDELNTIYCQASVTVAPYPAATDATVRAAILAGTLRSTLTGNRDTVTPAVASVSRPFALAVVSRKVNSDKSVTFELASDEVLIELRGSVSASVVDYGPGPVSVMTARSRISAVLNDFIAGGISFLAGTVDADLRRLKPERNLITNGGFELGILGWAATPNAGTLTWSNARALVGTRSLRFSAIGAGAAYLYQTAVPVTQQRWYKADAYISSQVSRSANIEFQLLDASGALVRSVVNSSVASPTSGFASLGVLRIFVDDPAATQIRLVINTAGNAAGNQHYVDEISMVEIDPATMVERAGFGKGTGWTTLTERPFYNTPTVWHGDTTDTAYYQYDWEGTAGNSTTKRTPLVNRDFNLLLMQPGQNVRDFLDPIIGATGGRLFCDEARDWRLVDNTYTVAGTIALSDVTNVIDTTDTVSLSESFDGAPTYFTGVVVEYQTLDANTNTITKAYDVAGTATGRVYRKVVQGGYPGAGEAAAILARAALRQRNIPVDAVTDLATTPGKALTLTRDGVNFTGRVSAVRFRWSAEGDADTMTVTPRNLVEV